MFARKSIPKRTQFGPLEGRVVTESPPNFGLVFKTTVNGSEGYLDISEEGEIFALLTGGLSFVLLVLPYCQGTAKIIWLSRSNSKSELSRIGFNLSVSGNTFSFLQMSTWLAKGRSRYH